MVLNTKCVKVLVPSFENINYILYIFQELQAIEKHELEMIALGNQYIMKSHKGEIEIDKDEFIKEKEKGE